jgi:hypothetical protein
VPASTHYLPGTSSPLGELRLALIDCFREQDRRMGVAVFNLAPAFIKSYGISNPAFTKCIDELAPQVKVKEPVRCSAAFGTALLPELPHIDLKADGVFVDDKRVEISGGGAWWKLEPTEVEGVTLPPEVVVTLMLGSANRDPRRYERPDELDLARPDPKPLSFGGGPHYCVGAALARAEAKAAFAKLASSTREITLASSAKPAWRPMLTLRGLTELQLNLQS